jgi:urocanate hydratase
MIGPTPTGNNLNCKGWSQEGAYRCLHNNLDPDVAERPEDLIVYGGTGKAARNPKALKDILESLKKLNNDESLLVQSGKPVAVFKTHPHAPRVLISNSMLVPHWANWDEFRKLEAQGLTMFGQMTAGSWIYIGTQGILQGTFETFAAAAQKHYQGSLKNRLIVSAGLGGMGGAQPLAATFNGAVFLGAEINPDRIQKRLKTKYLDEVTPDIPSAVKTALRYKQAGVAKSIGVCANAVDLLSYLKDQKINPDLLTDQTSAHDELTGYVPEGVSFLEALELRKKDPTSYKQRSLDTMVKHTDLMVSFHKEGVPTFDYGNNLRGQALAHGYKDAFAFPGFVPAYIRPLFCEGQGPFRWVALSGDPNDIKVTDDALCKLFPHKKNLIRWLKMAEEKVAFQGLPSRICWLGLGEREQAGLLFNDLVNSGKVKAPIAIGRDHLDCGSVASPNRETEGMKDGSDAIADWPVLNFALSTASGASWVSFHHGGGVGIGYALHAGLVIVADGTDDAAQRLERVLHNDPGLGVVRHADAGYEKAIAVAKDLKLNMPSL